MFKKNSIKSCIISLILVLSIGLSVLPFTSAQAASEPEAGNYPLLERLLKRERAALEKQGERLERTDENVSKVETLIEKAKTKGIDTTALEEALTAYQERLVTFVGFHEQAASRLANPAGFDENGKVTDQQAAQETLRQAGEAMRRGHLEITEASLDLRGAVRDFLKANRSAGMAINP
jgi:hypothetical protein